jgi:hypothetical protein
LLAAAQLIEAIAAVFDPEGSGTAHAIPNAAGLAVLQPLVLIALIVLVASAMIHRRNARV